MKRSLIFLSGFYFFMFTMAQNRQFTLDDLIPGGTTYKEMQPENRHFVFQNDKVMEQESEPEKGPERTKTVDYNLFVDDIQITSDGSPAIVYGKAVHRDEYGCTKGLFWSPDSTLLAFYRMDQSMVSPYPQVNITPTEKSQCYEAKEASTLKSRIAALEPDYYPMTGETSHLVTIGVYNTKTQKTIYLKAGDPTDRYFTNVAWGPASDRIYVIELNRDVRDYELKEYDAATGNCLRTLLSEHNDKYVEPLNPIQFLPWQKDCFILQSRKSGFNHLYLYRLPEKGEAQLISQLTQGEWEVLSVQGFSTAMKSIIYTSNESHPLNQSLYSVNTKGRRILLGNAEGWHENIKISESGRFIIDNYSTPTTPRSIDLINVKTGKARNLFTATDKLADGGYAMPQIRIGTLKAADGKTDLYYRMILPPDFDSKKKYPVVTYVYGGPHLHLIDARYNYSARGWDLYMAQRGYIMFSLDNRGAEHRGADFEQVTFHHLGLEEVQDQMKGVEYLRSLPYVDTDRMGIHGWSYGGYMTTSLMTRFTESDTPEPGTFKGVSPYKVGVAGGPVIDWHFYEVMYGERYMGTDKENPDGYEATTLLTKAENLKGKLLIIYGYNDPICVPQHTLSFLRACINADKYPDLFTYPGDGHNMSGTDRIHLHNIITNYFDTHLK